MDENIQMVTILGWERMKGASANDTMCSPFTIYNKKVYEMKCIEAIIEVQELSASILASV